LVEHFSKLSDERESWRVMHPLAEVPLLLTCATNRLGRKPSPLSTPFLPHDKRKGLKALHTLSAYATNARLTLAQLSVPEKTKAITAIPELLDQLAETNQLKGALVTIDAMGGRSHM
jgi:hypothetical protein